MKPFNGFKTGEQNISWKGGPVQRICQQCGILFLAIRAKVPGNPYSDRTGSKSKYCSKECSSKSCIKPKMEKNCEQCGKQFMIIPAKENAKYCSVECKHVAMKTIQSRPCPVCGIVFVGASNNSKYCSVKCSDSGRSATIPEKQCAFCGEKMTGRNARAIMEKIYCSRDCDAKRRMKSSEHHKFMQNKHAHLKRSRKANAEGLFTWDEWELLKRQYHHRCPCCGRPEPDIKLTKDHIVPLTRGGTNWISNIQPLCQSCNSRKKTRVIKY
jgi:5-methylcytosine-specific restriction endonuclease McrA